MGFEISDFGTIGAVHNTFLIANPTTNAPYGGGPIVVAPGEHYNGLPVTLKFIKATVPSTHDKLCVKPYLTELPLSQVKGSTIS